MKRHFAIGGISLLLCAFVVGAASGADVAKARLVPEQQAQTLGLTRAWFAQAPVDGDREEVSSATLLDGTLFITTDGGLLTAIDPEAGTTLWTVRVGSSKLSAPGVNSKIVAILCGTRLVVFDRFNGKRVDETILAGLPSSAPIVSEREIYAPLFSQRVHAYLLKEKESTRPELERTVEKMRTATEGMNLSPEMKNRFEEAVASKTAPRYLIEPLGETNPFSCPSMGVSLVAPTMGTQSYEVERIAWTTDQGWMLIGEFQRREHEDALQLLYKLQIMSTYSYTNEERLGNSVFIPRDDVASSPFYLKEDVSRQNLDVAPDKRRGGLFLVGSKSGRVFAMNDANGKARWMFLTNSAVSERIFALDQRAYVPTESGEYFALSLADGTEVWKANGVKRFVAASASRLYAIDELDRLVALNKENGTRIKALEIGRCKFPLFNRETDRVYLVSEDGLVQCLRETQQVEPLRYVESCAQVRERLNAEMEESIEKGSLGGKPKKAAPAKAVDAAAEPVEQSTAPADAQSDDDSVFDDQPEETPAVQPAAPAAAPSEPASSADEDDPFAANNAAPFGEDI